MDSPIPKVWRVYRGATSLQRAAALICVALAGCAAPRVVVLAGSELSVAVSARSPAAARADVDSKVVGKDAWAGAASGAAVGAMAAITCGPFAVFCIPFTGLLGGAVGGMAGAGVGLIENWPAERIAAMRSRINRFMENHHPVDQLQTLLAERAGGKWNVVTGPSPNKLHVDVRDFEVQLLRRDRAQLMLRIHVTGEAKEPDGSVARSGRQFIYLGPELEAAEWIDASDEALERSFRAAYQNLVESAIAMLSPA